MAVLVVVRLMNLFWMAIIFILLFVEKRWKHGIVLAKIAAGALMALGAAVVDRPVLALISQ